MIKYNLICKCGRSFESWFLSSSGFDSLCKKKLIKCIYCESSEVKKTVMAPRLTRKSNQIQKKNKLQKNIKKELINFKKYIEKNIQIIWQVGNHSKNLIDKINNDNLKSIYALSKILSENILRQKLLDCEAVKFGDFTLTSGKKSTYYVDLKLASTNPSMISIFSSVEREFPSLFVPNIASPTP